MKSVIRILFIIVVLCLCNLQVLIAQWSTDPTVNNAICTATGSQYQPAITSDGNGGAIITWSDYRSESNYDIYAQRISAGGAVLWTADGVVICTATSNQAYPTIVSDGSGGAIITWEDYRNGNLDIYAQRISADSTKQWTANGVAICTATGGQLYPTIISDDSGGAIITWQDNRVVTNYDIYAQRISAGGAVQWTADGVAICTATASQITPIIVSDGSKGAIITWNDGRSGSGTDFYAQRISAYGTLQWTADGVAICTATNEQNFPAIASDDSGGAIIVWHDWRNAEWDIFAQRISAGGAVQWLTDGVSICTATGSQASPTIVSDGSRGAIITWPDNRGGSNFDIYAQRISAGGAVQWTADGVAICMATGEQAAQTIVSDISGGAVIAWYDYRSGSNYDIYAQRISAGGTVQWTADGIAISTAAGYQGPPAIVSDGSGGAIITWEDLRIEGNKNIYAQRVYSNGNLYTSVENERGAVPNEFALCQNYPNPFNPSTTISFTLSLQSFITLKVFDALGREVATLINGVEEPGYKSVTFDASKLSSGVYYYRLQSGSPSTSFGYAQDGGSGQRYIETKKLLLLR